MIRSRTLARRVALLVATLALPGLTAAAQELAQAPLVDLPRYPSVSPDGRLVTFSWRGDLWLVPAAGGTATRLTVNPYDDLYSAFSPDGKRIAFTSARNSPGNLYVMNLDGSGLSQVTYLDRSLLLSHWGIDPQGNERLYTAALLDPGPFSAAKQYEVSPEGGDINAVHPAVGTWPVASPDGKKLLFTRGSTTWNWRGYRGPDNRDVWLLDRETGRYTRITLHNGHDGKARWLDNSTIVFVSDRLNNTFNLFRLTLGQPCEAAVPLTNYDRDGVDDFDVAHDTGMIVFSRWDRLHTLATRTPGATPVELVVRATDDESDRLRFQDVSRQVSEAALSPDGKTMAVIAYGEVYVRGTDSRALTRRVGAELIGRKRDLAWSADGEKLYFVCDASGREEIYEATVATTRSELRKRILSPATQPAATQPATQPADTTTQPATPAADPAPSEPKEKAEQVPPRRPTPATPTTPATPSAAGAAPTSASAAGEPSKWADALRFEVRKLFDSPAHDRSPTPSPDGKALAYERLGRQNELRLRDLATGEERVLQTNFANFDFRWSPDSQYMAYATQDRNNNWDVFVMPVDGSEPPVNISRHPGGDYSPRWSADGKILAFLSNRMGTGEDTAVFSVFLDRDVERLAPPELEAYYRDAAAAVRRRTPPPAPSATTRPARPAATPTKLNREHLDDAYLRLRQVTSTRGSASNLEIAPAGDRFFFVGTLGTARALLAVSRTGGEPTRVANAGNVQGISLTGDSITLVESGAAGATGSRAAVVRLPSGETEYYDPADRLRVDLEQLSRQKFLEAARVMELVFYNPDMNGVDWAANTAHYLPLAMAARTPDEFDFVANRFVGELNASHLGIRAPSTSSPLSQSAGRLGITVERVDTAAGPGTGLKVTDIMPDGPADRGQMKLAVGDIITAIDFTPIGPRDTLEQILTGKTGTEVVVSIRRDDKELDKLLTPTSFEALSNLAYNRWRLEKLEEVRKLSNGRLGYIHIQGMNQASLETYKRDLFAAVDGKDGLIIDVRWNGGGSTADLLLASIMSPYHAYTQMRGAPHHTDSYPSDRLFIPRFIGPINMLCNERSFSNAEIISHAFKTLKRGTLVGNQTAGGVISTGGATLLDGTTVRTPGRGWFTPDGTNMELNGAIPDILIVQTPDDEASGEDRQLKAAVEDLLKRLK